MKIPSFFMGKIIVTLFPFTDIPSGMKPSATKSSVLTRHPGSALNSRKVPKMPCFCGFYGVGSNEPVDEPSGFKRRGKIKLYQRRSYYALGPHSCLLCGFPYFICVLQFSVNPPPFIIYAFCKPCWMIIHSDTACFFIPSRHFQEFDRYSDRYCQDSLIFCLLLTMPNTPYLALSGIAIKTSHLRV